LKYLGEERHSYYRAQATEVDYPALDQPLAPEVSNTAPPHTIHVTDDIPIRDISLTETIQTALMNSQVLRTAGSFHSPGSSVLANPNNVPSVYDPAIQESGVLFGGRGVEAALSAFDAQLNASMIWGRNETV